MTERNFEWSVLENLSPLLDEKSCKIVTGVLRTGPSALVFPTDRSVRSFFLLEAQGSLCKKLRGPSGDCAELTKVNESEYRFSGVQCIRRVGS